MRQKRGFTLIEMLAVIAIIAVLVAIIVPVVTTSTTRAAAATNAANLRSVEGMLVTKSLDHPTAFKTALDSGTMDLIIQSDSPIGKLIAEWAIEKYATFTADANGTVTLSDGTTFSGLPAAKKVDLYHTQSVSGVDQGIPMSIVIMDGHIKATYAGYDVSYFAEVADSGSSSSSWEDESWLEEIVGSLTCLIKGTHEFENNQCIHCDTLSSDIMHPYVEKVYVGTFVGEIPLGICKYCELEESAPCHN